MNFTPEQDQYIQLLQTRAYYQGMRDGVKLYAHWKNGVQYVGTVNTTLATAIDAIHEQETKTLNRFKMLKEI